MIQNLQDKFSGFINKLSRSISKPEKNFLKASCLGILSSQSCIVRRTTQSHHEKISSKKTQERLIYHLVKEKLNNNISDTLLQQQCRKLKRNSLILVDLSDIIKKYAKKMEGLSKVRDGNDGKWKTGYDALDIVVVNRQEENISILPIHSQLHSNAVEIDTMKNKLSELNKFVYYKLAVVIKHCFNKIGLYRKIIYQSNKLEPLQLRLPWL